MKTIEITTDELNKIVQAAMKMEIPKEEEQKNKIFFKIGRTRRAKGWTYEELSKKSGVEEEAIMKMEAMIANPQLIDVIKICNALDLNVTAN